MNILYVAASSFPEGSAYSTRVYGICKALLSTGNKVFVLTDSLSRRLDSNMYEGICVYSTSKHLSSERTRFDNWTSKYSMNFLLRKIIKNEKIDCIISSSLYTRYYDIYNIAHSKNVKVILETCEWFDENNWAKGKEDKGYRAYIEAWDNCFHRNDGVIAISRMLEEHYKEFSKVLRLATILDVRNIAWSNEIMDDKVRLVFSGSIAWGKDRVIEIIQAMQTIKSPQIEFHVFGPSERELAQQVGELQNDDIYKKQVIIHERLPHDALIQKLKHYDLGVILRPDRRQSNAGFPTKLAEYMAVGLPVLANDTGDISLYLHDQENGFLIPTIFSKEHVIRAIEQYCSMTKQERATMKRRARKCAEDNFDYRVRAKEIESFICLGE